GNLGDLRFRMRAGVARIGHQVVEPAIFDGELAGVVARSATRSFCHGHFLHPMNSTSYLGTPHAPFWPRMFFLRALVCDRKLPDFQAPPGASGSRSPCSFRRRGAHGVAETAILARCLPAVTGRTQRLPPGPVPEHRFIAAVRIDVVDDRCRTDHVMTTAIDAERMRAQKCQPFRPPPLRAVKRADNRIPLAVMVPVALTLLAPSSRTVDGGANGHAGDLGGNDSRVETTTPARIISVAGALLSRA